MEGEVAVATINYLETQSMNSLIISLFIIFVVYMIFSSIVRKRRSKQYREFLGDMYVAGKIRKYASADDINLANEASGFKLWSKKKELEWNQFDEVVEGEMKERIIDDIAVSKEVKTNKGPKANTPAQ